MTLCCETPNENIGPWDWLGDAITLAYSISLHRDSANPHIELKERHLRRRIWWPCSIRDRLLAFCHNRPSRIVDIGDRITMLTLQDFSIEAISEIQLDHTLKSCAALTDPSRQIDLASMYIAQARLCVCISHVLPKTCTARKYQDQTCANFTKSLENLRHIDELYLCSRDLDEWNRDLSRRYAYSTPKAEDITTLGTPFIIQRALLHMIYSAIVMALYRLKIIPPSYTTSVRFQSFFRDHSSESSSISGKRTREASNRICRICHDLLHLNYARFLPAYSLVAVFPAVMNHLLDLKSLNPCTRRQASLGFRQCVRVVEELRNVHMQAEHSWSYIDATTKIAALDISTEKLPFYENIEGTSVVHLKTIVNPDKTSQAQGFSRFLVMCGFVDDSDDQQWRDICDGVMKSEGGDCFLDSDWV